jgi:hypothetical protein
MKGTILRHEFTSPAPSAAQRGWIASLIVLPPSQEKTMAEASTWREFFSAFLPSAKAGYPLDRPRVDSSVGRIEALDSAGIRGWALRLPADSQPLEVECFIGAYSVGRAVCSEYRPDLAELFGCSSTSGFSINFEPNMPIGKLIGLETRLFDATNKTLIDGPVDFRLSGSEPGTGTAKVHSRVASLEWQLGRLKSVLKEFDAHAKP